MSEYGSDWSDHDYKEYKDDKEIKKEIDKEVDVEKEFKTDYDPQDLDSKEYHPFTPPDLTLKDDDSKEYHPFTPPDLTLKDDDSKEYHPFTPPDLALKDDDSKEYHPFTPPDLTLKEKNTVEEIKEDIIKENEPEFIGKKTIDHEINFDHIFERDLKEIVKHIKEAEELHAIYAEDIMIPSSEKEAVEQYYLEQIKDDGVIIIKDLYFENTHNKDKYTTDHTQEISKNSTDLDNNKSKKELNSEIKANYTEIDVKEISLANDIEYENKVHESKEINDHHEEIKIQESIELDVPKSEAKNTLFTDMENEVPQKYSSGQQTAQILKQEVEEITNKESLEIKEEKQNEAQETRQNEIKDHIIQEVNNEGDKKKITKDFSTEKVNNDDKNIEQEAEIKEGKQEKIHNKIELKEEWEKTLVEWIRDVKDEDISPEKKEELIKFIIKYRKVRENYTRLYNQYLKNEPKEITEEEKQELKDLIEEIKKGDEKAVEMYKELNTFRYFFEYNKKRWYNSVIDSKKEKYPELLAKKLRKLQDDNYQELSVEINNNNYELLKKRYNKETGGRAIYGGKETKGFKRWKEELIEIQKELNKNLDQSSEHSEELHELKEEWA